MDALEDHHTTKIISSDDSYFEMSERGQNEREKRKRDRNSERGFRGVTGKHETHKISNQGKVSFNNNNCLSILL